MKTSRELQVLQSFIVIVLVNMTPQGGLGLLLSQDSIFIRVSRHVLGSGPIPLVQLPVITHPCLDLPLDRLGTTCHVRTIRPAVGLVVIDQENVIYHSPNTAPTDSNGAIQISIHCGERFTQPHLSIVLSVSATSDSTIPERTCFPQNHVIFHVYEGISNVVLGRLGWIILPEESNSTENHWEMTYIIESDAVDLMVTPVSELVLRSPLDYEEHSELQVTASCKRCRGDDSTFSCRVETARVDIIVHDIDDTGPKIMNQKTGLEVFKDSRLTMKHGLQGTTVSSYAVVDGDMTALNLYTTAITSSIPNLLHTTQIRTMRNPNSKLMFVWTDVQLSRDISLYEAQTPLVFSLELKDTSLCRANQSDESSDKVVFNVTVDFPMVHPPLVYPLTVLFPEHTSTSIPGAVTMVELPGNTFIPQLYRVVALRTLYSHMMSWALEGDPVFKVTPRDGIVYVWNSSLLAVMGNQVNRPLVLTARDQYSSAPQTLQVKVTKGQEVHHKSQHNCTAYVSCSLFHSESSCVTSCGLGAPTQVCVWRQSNGTGMTSTYSTCSPDLVTCPDGSCDELEQTIPQLCPQDCTSQVVGSGKLRTSPKPSQGISSAAGVCTCDSTLTCTCMTRLESLQDRAHPTPDIDPTQAYSTQLVVMERSFMDRGSVWFSGCDSRCLGTTVVGGLAVCIVILLTALAIHRNLKKKATRQDPVVAPSIENSAIQQSSRDYRAPPLWSLDNCLDNMELVSVLSVDEKWEFPRESLCLEKVLGEGEFGIVARARATNIAGSTGEQIVAVKMLKEQSSSAELRDLMSEYNLMKEVCHRNVIKLLGACIKNGPPLLIVEFCELGNLKSYLQHCRLNGCVTGSGLLVYQVPSNQDTGTNHMTEVLTNKDLLSLAWQIANGMQYLCEMKIVHRDLAARNVLVTKDKLAKVSDFGLSRDIYEEDRYTKRTKGRVPVKWMAPESLFQNVYTTRSDVWSYGVTLWEICTLGGAPYPGISPERLCVLIKQDYRMPQPDGCSNQVYEIMKRCWSYDPLSRPGFKQITNIVEKLLQENGKYLDIQGLYRYGSSQPPTSLPTTIQVDDTDVQRHTPLLDGPATPPCNPEPQFKVKMVDSMYLHPKKTFLVTQPARAGLGVGQGVARAGIVVENSLYCTDVSRENEERDSLLWSTRDETRTCH